MLFNIDADMLAILIARAKEDGQIGSLIPHLVEGGISILQYADDTILFLEHDTGKAVNMKLILRFFEELLGLKINYHKSEIFCFGKAKEEEEQYKQLFGCESGSLPIWGYQSITENLKNQNGILLKVVLKENLAVGLGRCFHMGTVWY
jgi:hypothetical protein